jgi:hypothetical protein
LRTKQNTKPAILASAAVDGSGTTASEVTDSHKSPSRISSKSAETAEKAPEVLPTNGRIPVSEIKSKPLVEGPKAAWQSTVETERFHNLSSTELSLADS